MPDPRVVLLAVLLAAAPLAQAHGIRVFAYAEGERISGYAYFAGGSRAAGVAVSITDAEGEVVARLETDAEGEFSHPVSRRQDYRVTAGTGDGHRAEWAVDAEQLPKTLPAAPETQAGPHSAQPDPPPTAGGEAAAGESTVPLSEIEQAVARQVRPLREELRAHRERLRLTDVLGGIGYIFGVAGLALWWRSRGSGRRP